MNKAESDTVAAIAQKQQQGGIQALHEQAQRYGITAEALAYAQRYGKGRTPNETAKLKLLLTNQNRC